MPRLLLTFSTLRSVIAANKILRESDQAYACRVTPVPGGLEKSICGMAVELLEPSKKDIAVKCLNDAGLEPTGIHEIP